MPPPSKDDANDGNEYASMYKHANRAEYMAFLPRLMSRASEHKNKEVIKAFKHAVDGDAHGLRAECR